MTLKVVTIFNHSLSFKWVAERNSSKNGQHADSKYKHYEIMIVILALKISLKNSFSPMQAKNMTVHSQLLLSLLKLQLAPQLTTSILQFLLAPTFLDLNQTFKNVS